MTIPQSEIQFPLDRGERQLWSGVPEQGVVLRPTDAFMVPFSLFWAGFVVFWESSVLRMERPGFFALWGIPFVVAGAYITVGRFFVDARRRRRTAYGLTNDRIIITSGSTTKSLMLGTLTDATLTERANGSGTITFGPTYLRTAMYVGTPMPGITQPPAFELIPDARRVYGLIREAQEATRGRAS